MQLPANTDIPEEVPWAPIPTFRLIDRELREVADCIYRSLLDPATATELTPLYDHLCARSGKMIRPGMVLLAGKCLGQVTDEHLRVSAMVEMIHSATLLHDDVIDDGRRRRGGATVNSLWGNESAVLLGDFVLSRVFKMAADLAPSVSKVLAETAVRVCEGELRQVVRKGNWQLGETEYIDIITEKSASFFSGCCRLGAMLAGARDDQAEALSRYGLYAGIAFQIADDILDITGDEKRMGKNAQNDFDMSKVTLPVIHLLQNINAPARASTYAMLESPAESKNELASMLVRHGSLRYARQRARDYVMKALASLKELPPGDAANALAQTARFMADRST